MPKEFMTADDWMFHKDANPRLMALVQCPTRDSFERYSANQPGLYYQPASRMFYRVTVQGRQRVIYRLSLKEVLKLMDEAP